MMIAEIDRAIAWLEEAGADEGAGVKTHQGTVTDCTRYGILRKHLSLL